MKMNLKKYFEKDKKILIICSSPYDADSIGSGLIISLYLKSIGKETTVVFPRDKRRDDVGLDYLPFYNQIEFIDSREVVAREKFDALVLVDGSNLIQFYDDRKVGQPAVDLSLFEKRLHIDHHPGQVEKLGTKVIKDNKTSSTAEIIIKQIVPKGAIDSDMATLGYAAILGDTGTFQWNYFPSTFQVAGLLIEKGAKTEIIIDKLNFSKNKLYFKLLALAINSTVYDDSLAATFIYLSDEFAKSEKLDDYQLRILKNIYLYDVARRIPEYPLGFVLAYDVGRPGIIHLHGRGNTLRNKIDLPKFFTSIGGNGGGHFNAAAMDFIGSFEECKKKLLTALEKAVSRIHTD